MTRVAILLALASCLQPHLVPCGDDVLCPLGTMCIETLSLCATQDQLDACTEQIDGATCNVDGALGECRDGICLVPVCGDGFVEPGEMCDDGNTDPNDGCNSGCSSTEVCGNGVLDPTRGETCDDGNHVSGDACDSACRPEQTAWTIEGTTPLYRSPGHQTYDVAHRQLLHVTEALTWVWNGTTWSVVSSTGLPSGEWRWSQLVYAPDRMTAVLVASVSNAGQIGALRAWEWNGSAWTEITLGGAPLVSAPLAAYDTKHRVVLLLSPDVGGYRLSSIDLASGVVASLPAPPTTSSFHVGFAFDDVRGAAVFTRYAGANNSTTFEWNGTAWTSGITTSYDDLGTLTFDAQRGQVIAVGTTMWAWSGTTWTLVPGAASPSPRQDPEVTYDHDRQRVMMFGGKIGQQLIHDIYEWNGSTGWSASLAAWPSQGFDFYVAFDPRAHELVHVSTGDASGVETWTYDGAWHEQPRRPVLGQQSPYASAIAYDPVRDAFVTNATDRSTYQLHDHVWEMIEAPGSSSVNGIGAATYDPSRGGVVGVTGSATWFLASTASQWTMIGSAPITGALPGTIAFDARTNRLVMTGTYVQTSQFDGQKWLATVSPGREFTVVANERRGTVELLSPNRPAYERIEGAWFELPRPPFGITGLPSYDAASGELLVVGGIDNARVVVRRRTTGVAPIDACTGSDDDGDALVDCADPDCWWSCTTCPPYASCP